MFWSWWFIVYLAVPLLFVVGCVRVVIRATTAGRKGPKAPACERCKYPIEGLSGWQCPECGSDVRQTGIITRAMEVRRRGTMAGAILALTLGIAVVGFFGHGVALNMYLAWGGAAAQSPVTMIWKTTLLPASGEYGALVVESDFDFSAGAGIPDSLTFQINLHDGDRWSLFVDPEFGTARVLDEAGTFWGSELELGAEAFRQLYTRAGLDPDSVEISKEINELAGGCQQLADGSVAEASQLTWNAFVVAQSNVTAPPAPPGNSGAIDWEEVIRWTALAVSAALWIGGLVWIIIRRRKLLEEHGFGATAPAASGTTVSSSEAHSGDGN